MWTSHLNFWRRIRYYLLYHYDPTYIVYTSILDAILFENKRRFIEKLYFNYLFMKEKNLITS